MSQQDQRPRVEDPGEYNQRQRLEAIASARRQARDIRLQGEIGTIDVDVENAFYTATQSYAMEIEWLIREHGSEVYSQAKLGELTIPVPAELQNIQHGKISWKDGFTEKRGRIIGGSRFEQKSQPIVGLIPSSDTPGISFINLPPTWTETWTVNIDFRHEQPQQRTFESTVGIPYAVSLGAFQLCNKFLNEMDLDARLEDELSSDYV